MIIKPYVVKLALTYLSARQDNRFINFISFISIVGILLGVMVLITVLSIMNGFQAELRDRILGMTAHLTVFEQDNQLRNWSKVRELVLPLDDITGAAPNILKQALITHGSEVKGVFVRGILPNLEKTVSKIEEYVDPETLNSLRPNQFQIILGVGLANQLGASIGSKVTLVVPQANSGIVGSLPRLRRFEVAGIMNVGMNDYDNGMVLVHMNDATKLYRMKNTVSNLQIQIKNLFDVNKINSQLGAILQDREYYAITWQQQHSNFFQAIQLEKRIMFIIVALIIFVATFNVVSTMVMVVNEKKSAIAILRTQGATKRDIVSLFFLQGIFIGLSGTVLGCLLGALLSLNIDVIVPAIESLFDIKFFPPDVYYISIVPSDLQLNDVLLVAGFSFLCSILATLYPAKKSSQIQPAEILRHD